MGKGAEGLDADEDGRMRVIENDAELVRGEVGEIVDGEFLEGGNEVGRRLLGFGGVGVGFKLVLARPGVENHAEQPVHRAEENAEEDEATCKKKRIKP